MRRYDMKLFLAVCMVVSVLLAVSARAEEPKNVTMIQLLANPEKFDGKVIRVIGFLRIEFEGNVLYPHREDYENSILGNGIWVDVTPEMRKETKSINMHYVIMEGIFSATEHGHEGAWSGSLKKISRAQLWHQ
jgi:hypothetical protein